jgi:hypothetical protein
MTQLENTTLENSIEYYQLRLSHILSLWEKGETDLIDKNKDEIQKLVEEYEKFEPNSKYIHSLSGAIKELVLGYN